jgi:hypothetical protein
MNYAFLSVSFFEGFKENIRGQGRNFEGISGKKCQERNFTKEMSGKEFHERNFRNEMPEKKCQDRNVRKN